MTTKEPTQPNFSRPALLNSSDRGTIARASLLPPEPESDSPPSPLICFYTRPISFSQAVQYLTRIHLSDEPFGGRAWLMLIRTAAPLPEPNLDEFCEELGAQIGENLAREVLRQAREAARATSKSAPKMGSWSPTKARSPARGAKQRFVDGTTFQQRFTTLEAAVRHYPLPWPYSRKGAPPTYAREAVLTLVLLTKLEGGSYARVVQRAMSSGLNCLNDAPTRFGSEAAVPCPSYLHRIATQKLPLAFYEQMLRHLDADACRLYAARLGLPTPKVFVVDGTDLPAPEMELRQANQYTAYTAQRAPVQATIRLATNTVFNVQLLEASGQAPLDVGVAHVPPGSTVLADKLFDIEAHHQAAEAAQVEFHVPGKQFRGKPYHGEARARTRARFDHKEYRQRKKGERPFGNLTTRELLHLHNRSPRTRQIELAL